MIDLFIAKTNHPQLKQRKAAIEAVYTLRTHTRITPPVLMSIAKTLNLGSGIESAEMFATWLMDDGWINYSAKPFAGKGIGAVWSYEPTAKWARFQEAYVELNQVLEED